MPSVVPDFEPSSLSARRAGRLQTGLAARYQQGEGLVVVVLLSSSSSYSSLLHCRCVRAVLCPAGKPRREHGEGCPGQALSWHEPCHVRSGELPSGTGGSRLSQDRAGACVGHLPAAPCRLEIPAGSEPQSKGLCLLPQGLLGDTQLLPALTLHAVAGHLAPPPMAQTSPVPTPHSPQAPSCPCSALVRPGCGISGLLFFVFFTHFVPNHHHV